ncbi:hypothetical protein OGAPHI_000173 [Ogataea philodendri]|uniref:Reverse transcriptase Ty1/copia-type domain-containing protein n=1 Tax=Ogataea philodendri TaxID=1378263 RepID=A0A9P8PH54_9ASCO|nr:uncharacterized protein OGAPHI_000173 [Ogataea philodendri]KAH3671987.1 hypothetical protein OGAPHI_000173 [Ogataea philodendri]
MDVTTAFLNGDLAEEIYMQQHPCFVLLGLESKVCRLYRSFYGLKQAPLYWNLKIDSLLCAHGFSHIPSEPRVYVLTPESPIFVALYADDLLILSSQLPVIRTIQQLLHRQFRMKDQGAVRHFLGLNIQTTASSVPFILSTYLGSLLAAYGLSSCNLVSTPDNSLPWKFSHPVPADITTYRSIVGTLLLAANTAGPDIAFVVSKLSHYLNKPQNIHLAKAKHVLKYLKGTLNCGIVHPKPLQPGTDVSRTGYCDAVWAGDNKRFVTSGYILLINNVPIS